MTTETTNEEKRVAIYNNQNPTVSNTVTAATPWSELNLNWTERDLPEGVRTKHVHRLHPYLGKYIPQLVEIFLRKCFQAGQTVFDPFMGSGTTLVQAKELGIHSLGYDISAFNVLLSRAKTNTYNLERVEWEIHDALNQAQSRLSPEFSTLPLFDPEIIAAMNSDDYLRMWFAPRALAELVIYRDVVAQGEYEYKDLLKVILSRAARSARLTTHFDLDFPKRPQTAPYHCYKHARTCTPITEAFKFLNRYSIDTLERIREFASVSTEVSSKACHADSRFTPIPPIHGVITSPPYVGLIDYHAQHAYAYHLLGLEDLRTQEIGPATGGTSQRAKKQYQADIAMAFQNALDAMPVGAPLIVVAGDKHNLYEDIARVLSVEVETILERHVNRRTGRRSGEFYEKVFIWRKV